MLWPPSSERPACAISAYARGVLAGITHGTLGAAPPAGVDSQPTPPPVPFQCPQAARCFYVDYASGSDLNSGMSEASPWQHAPGMQGCSSRCASTTPQANDYYILKGGVTWPVTVLPWVCNGRERVAWDLLGVDPSWYAGSLWSRPVLDGRSEYSGVAANHDQVNEFLDMSSTQYVTVDDFEFTGAHWSTTSQGGNMYLNANRGSTTARGELFPWLVERLLGVGGL